MVGESVTLADISAFTTLVDLYKNLLDGETKTPFVNVNRWFDTILNQTKVQEALKKYSYQFSYCTTPVKVIILYNTLDKFMSWMLLEVLYLNVSIYSTMRIFINLIFTSTPTINLFKQVHLTKI